MVALQVQGDSFSKRKRDYERRRDVALRKESVDRNTEYAEKKLKPKTSLSARRAWIEITIKKEKNQ